MKIIRGYENTPPQWRETVAAIGNFDGVHIGHQAVIRAAVDKARAEGLNAAVITFEPHPRQFFTPGGPPFRLFLPRVKAQRCNALGVNVVFELSFDERFSRLDAAEFGLEVISRGLGVTHIVVGEDFRYGYRRMGNPGTLARDGERLGFGVTILEIISRADVEVSSTAIRNELSLGHPGKASDMLGCWHQLRGQVNRGAGRGHDLDMPTANIELGHQHQPKLGIYAVLIEIHDDKYAGRHYQGAASVGTRPTFGEHAPNLEVHIFDFNDSIYGCDMSVFLVGYLREEIAFDSTRALVSQMKKDCHEARRVLASRIGDTRGCSGEFRRPGMAT